MTCAPQITGWAEDILDSLAETTISVPSVATWLKNNLGPLNVRLRTSFQIVGGDLCISPDMSAAVSGVYNEMYYCYYYGKKAMENLGASDYDWTQIKGDDQGYIQKVSRKEVAKVYRDFQNDCHDRLNALVGWYHSAYNALTPVQVLYNERNNVTAGGLPCPPLGCYSSHNHIWSSLG